MKTKESKGSKKSEETVKQNASEAEGGPCEHRRRQLGSSLWPDVPPRLSSSKCTDRGDR